MESRKRAWGIKSLKMPANLIVKNDRPDFGNRDGYLI